MTRQVTIIRGRSKTIEYVSQRDLSGSSYASHIRVQRHPESELIAEWDVDFVTDGTDGKLLLHLTAEQTAAIEASKGYMDIKALSTGLPEDVEQITSIISVVFEWPVTP